MRIALISGASSVHTIRWANGLVNSGHEVHLITQHAPCDILSSDIILHKFPSRGLLGYFTMARAVKKLLKKIKPDIVNAHYASGYATTARLANIRPYLLSVWGSDVYDFPEKSFIHKLFVRKNLISADRVASTSYCMAEQVYSIAPKLKEIIITPFGVDMKMFDESNRTINDTSSITIGTVKTMEDVYGIDILIKAFSILYNKLTISDPTLARKIYLRLVGDGSKTEQLRELTETLGIKDRVNFVGRVQHQFVPQELAKLDIYVALSHLESFGVAAIEASAAGLPIVVSDAGGLSEVTLNGISGIVVPRNNPEMAAIAIEKLVLDPELRSKMGTAGKNHVNDNYQWHSCIKTMEAAFNKTIESYNEK